MSDRTTLSSDGIPIRYSVVGAGETAVVLLHGWAMDRHIWDAQVPRLAGRFRVVAIDLAGHGESGSGRGDWTMQAFAEDVRAVVEALSLDRVVLVGHSMSGSVALEAARRLGRRVAGIVPVDTLTSVDGKRSAEALEGFFAGLEADYVPAIERACREWMLLPTTDAAVASQVLGRATAMAKPVAIAVLRHAFTYDARPALREVRVPIVAVNGDRFPTDLEAARRYAPEFDVVTMSGVSHYPMLDDPARFGDLLDQALRRVLG